jgi:DNA-binding FadR family transcriptional regulator
MYGAAAAAPTSVRLGAEHALSGHGQVARVLGTEILAGRYPPGTNLPGEAELLHRFGVSRTVLREVIKTLSAKGLVSSKTRVGTRVSDPVRWNLFDATVLSWRVSLGLDDVFRGELFEIRRLIEPRAAELAAMRREPASIAELRRLLERMRAGGHNPRSFAEADLDFHLAIGAASGNTLMRSLAGVIEAALVASFTVSSPTESMELQAENVRNHERIVDAIEAGDQRAASDAMLHVIEAGAVRFAAADERRASVD